MTATHAAGTVPEEHDKVKSSMRTRRRTATRSALQGLLLLLLLTLAGCQTQKDAAAAAQQTSATAATLQTFYRSLSQMVQKTGEAQAAQSYLTGVPYDEDARQQLATMRMALQKRTEAADALRRLAAPFADVTTSSAASDAAKAADALNTELSTIKAIKTGSNETEALKVAVNAVVNALKAKDEIKAARLISPVANALSSFFDSEADLYDAVADSYYRTAAGNSNALIDRHQVSTALLYRSSLQPFGLTPAISDPDLQKLPAADLKARVAERLREHVQQDQAAVADLGKSLQTMRDRVAQVAAGKPLHATLPPLTLEGVKAWVADVKTDLGEN